jgi:hypothetical protein
MAHIKISVMVLNPDGVDVFAAAQVLNTEGETVIISFCVHIVCQCHVCPTLVLEAGN